MAGAEWCRATIRYAGAGGGVPAELEVAVHDGRVANLPRWTECGFQLERHPSVLTDWTDDEVIASVHYAEVEALARSITGCDVALVSDHVKRSAGARKQPREQEPVHLVHSDFADDYGDVVRESYRDVHGRGAAALSRNGVSSEDVERAGRIMMLQVWRNVGPPRMDYPIAFCDARTVTLAETRPFLYTGYVAGGRSFNALAVMAPDQASRHQWYSYPEMVADEVVVFRTFDTDLLGGEKTYFTPHTAFRDPEVAPGQPARFSIEIRTTCLFF